MRLGETDSSSLLVLGWIQTFLSLHPQFLYRCTTGLLAHESFGCIMADEMGLGGWSLLNAEMTLLP